MAGPKAIVQVRLKRKSGLAVDDITNTFHFEADDNEIGGTRREKWDLDAPGLVSRITTFYARFNGFWSGGLATTGHTVTVYDHEDPMPRVPRIVTAFGTTEGATSLPNEVALCMSFAAAPVAGVDQRRRRGRVFLGPWHTNALETFVSTDSDGRPDNLIVAGITGGVQALCRGGSGTFRLAVYSPTNDVAGSLDDAYNDVASVWVDNAWDTVRSRGAAATTRSTVVLT